MSVGVKIWNTLMATIFLCAATAFVATIAPPLLGSFLAFKKYHNEHFAVDREEIARDQARTAHKVCPDYFKNKDNPGEQAIWKTAEWCENFR